MKTSMKKIKRLINYCYRRIKYGKTIKVVVDPDGNGDYTSVEEAMNDLQRNCVKERKQIVLILKSIETNENKGWPA
jgi:hypothetical protein